MTNTPTWSAVLTIISSASLAHAAPGQFISIPLLPIPDQRHGLSPPPQALPKTSLLRASPSTILQRRQRAAAKPAMHFDSEIAEVSADPEHSAHETAWEVFTGPLGTAAPHAASVYFADVELGQKHQRFSVLFDTGSSRLVVPDANCTETVCTRHPGYQNSSAAIGLSFSMHYGDGDLDVVKYRDDFCVGGECVSGFPVYSIMADRSRSLGAFKYDGILGMGPASGFAFQLPDVLGHGTETGTANTLAPLFAIYLSRDESVRRSEVTIGGSRPEFFAKGSAQDLAWFTLSAPGDHWAFDLKDIKIAGKRLFLCGYGSKDRCRGVLDSGTSQLVASQKLASKVKAKLGVDFDCGNIQKLPSLSFLAMDGREFALTPEDYVQRLTPSGGCFAAVSPVTEIDSDVLLLGLPFLRRFYSVFDAGVPRRVGIAEAAMPSKTTVASKRSVSSKVAEAKVPGTSRDQVRKIQLPSQVSSSVQAESRHKGRRGFAGPWRWENGTRSLVEACSVLLVGVAAAIVTAGVLSRPESDDTPKVDTSGIKFVNAYPVD